MYVVLTTVLVLVFFTDYRQEELMGCHPRGVTRSRARLIGVNSSELFIKGKEI